MEHIEIRFGDNIETPATEEKSFEEMFQSVNPMFCFSKRVWKPQMDIFETREQIIIQAVKISGNRKCSQPDPTATYRLAEIQFGQFERVLYLPSVIDVEKVSASFSSGFLELKLGKLIRKNIKQKQNVSIDFL